MPLIEYWSDIKKNMISKKETYVSHLITELNKRIEKGNDHLPYIDEANKLISSPYPTPNYLLERGYRKCEVDDKVFFVPLSDKEFRTQANIPILSDNTTSDSMVSTLSDMSDIKGNITTLPDDDAEQKTNTEYSTNATITEIPNKELPQIISSNEEEATPSKTNLDQKEKRRKGVIFLIGAVCILIICILYIFNFTNNKEISEQEPSLKHNIATIDNITSSTENIEENSTQEQSSSSIYDSYESSPPVRITFTNGTVVESFESIKVSQDDKGAVTVTIIDDKGNINPLSDSISGNVEDIP